MLILYSIDFVEIFVDRGDSMKYVISDEVIQRADKCPHNFSCLETGKCFCACEVDHVHSKDILILGSHSSEAASCPNYFNFEGNYVCICPVHYHLYQYCGKVQKKERPQRLRQNLSSRF